MISISNNYLNVIVDELGASINSVINSKTKKEYIYTPIEGSWPFKDVVIFPLIGEGKFKLNNKIYNFKNRHGIVRDKVFNVKKITKGSVSLYLNSSLDLSLYNEFPYKYEFIITYKLIKNKLLIKTQIINLDNKTIYFSYASHTGLLTDNTSILNFSSSYDMFLLNNEGKINLRPTKNLLKKTIKLNKDLFRKYDTLIFNSLNKKTSITLTNIDSTISLNFSSPTFALWSNKNKGDFICIEPWRGISNYKNESIELSKRKYINKLDKKESKTFSYYFIFN